jgi:hypothetical protein
MSVFNLRSSVFVVEGVLCPMKTHIPNWHGSTKSKTRVGKMRSLEACHSQNGLTTKPRQNAFTI